MQNIPLPATKGELKKFLGVANYFRSHVKNHSILAQPLQTLLPMYTRTHRNHKIVWTEQMEKYFTDLRDNVANCPKLFFMDDYWRIGMEIDASDYGIGGFLFQVHPETEEKIPIQFVSKSLTGPQLRWSTPEKEMYAKFFTVKKLDYVIGNRPFTCYTDHKNNILNKSTGSDKVLRWQLFLQNYDITDVYIKGAENETTDSFSRLCSGPRHKNDRIDIAHQLSQLCEVSDSNEYLTLLEEYDLAPAATEYLNLLKKTEQEDTLAAVAENPTLINDIFNKLSKVHNSQVGHLGIERTLYRLQRLKTLWPAMRRDIKLFIQQCPNCQKMSRLKIPIHTAPFTTATYGLMKKKSVWIV